MYKLNCNVKNQANDSIWGGERILIGNGYNDDFCSLSGILLRDLFVGFVGVSLRDNSFSCTLFCGLSDYMF